MSAEMFQFSAAPAMPIGYEPDTRSRFRKVLDWLRRRPFTPKPIYPDGAQSVTLVSEGVTYYFPAVTFTIEEERG
jgi:hypothetical protein